MRRTQRILFLATFVAIMPVLAGCADFDVDKLDVFGLMEKKKLAGDRQPVFPEGVPGVTQGVPQQYIKGNQPPPEAAVVVAPEPAPPAEEPKPKPKRKVAAKPKPVNAAPVQPVSQQPQAQPQQAQQGSAAQPQSGGTTAWPAPPPAGTFSR
jgi:hypothetical protein